MSPATLGTTTERSITHQSQDSDARAGERSDVEVVGHLVLTGGDLESR